MRFQFLLLALVAAVSLAQDAYEVGYNDGLQSGYYDGLETDFEDAPWIGHHPPANYDGSEKEDYDGGYSAGYDDGLNDGLEDVAQIDDGGPQSSIYQQYSDAFLPVSVIATAWPTTLAQEYSTNLLEFASDFALEWKSALFEGHQPSWFSALPTDAQGNLLPPEAFLYLTSAIPAAIPSALITAVETHNVPAAAGGSASTSTSIGNAISTATAPAASPTTMPPAVTLTSILGNEAPEKNASTSSDGSESSAGRTTEVQAWWIGLLGAMGIAGLLAL